MTRKERCEDRRRLLSRIMEWDDHLAQVMLAKHAEVMQEACQVLEKHGCPVKKELKSELYYSSTL